MTRYEVRQDGYCRLRVWCPIEGRDRYVYEHQLVALMEGADPDRIFSAGEWHVHHINGCKWDNRPENLEVERSDRHAYLTFEHDYEADTDPEKGVQA